MILHDAIVPFHPKDRPTVEMCCSYLRNNMGIRRIFLITSENPHIPDTTFINERELNDIISLDDIRRRWEATGSRFSNRSGWIYQQLLKLGADQWISDLHEDYLICDSDIMFLNNPYGAVEQGKFPYNKAYTGEYNTPYRNNYNRLMKEQTESGFSFINHNMVFNKECIRELKQFIEQKNGMRWDLAIINALDFNSFSDFSEYDLYGNWMFKYKKDKLVNVPIRIKDINKVPSGDDLNRFRNEGFHILSSQEWSR
jgi:hypothetical protein